MPIAAEASNETEFHESLTYLVPARSLNAFQY